MSESVKTAGQGHRDMVAEQITEAIGDGTAITADDFSRMGYGERSKLYEVNRAKYAELSAEQGRKVTGR